MFMRLIPLLFSTLRVSSGFVQAQDNAHFVGQKNFVVQRGEVISLRCMLSANAVFLITKQIRFVHKSAKDGTETVVSVQESLTEAYAHMTDTYRLRLRIHPTIYAELTLKQVRDDMDGQYSCQVVQIYPNYSLQESVTTNVTVVAGVQNLEMVVGDQHLILDESKTITFHEGQIKVECTVTGTNPEPIIHLKLGDQMIDTLNFVRLDNGTNVKRRPYRGEAEYTLDFTPNMFGKRLSCHAETHSPPGFCGTLPDKTVSVMLRGDCPIGKYGMNCMEKCGYCNGTCDEVDGHCPGGCEEGYIGTHCNKTVSVQVSDSCKAFLYGLIGATVAVIVILATVGVLRVLLAGQWRVHLRKMRKSQNNNKTTEANIENIPPDTSTAVTTEEGTTMFEHAQSDQQCVCRNDYAVLDSTSAQDTADYDVIQIKVYENI